MESVYKESMNQNQSHRWLDSQIAWKQLVLVFKWDGHLKQRVQLLTFRVDEHVLDDILIISLPKENQLIHVKWPERSGW